MTTPIAPTGGEIERALAGADQYSPKNKTGFLTPAKQHAVTLAAAYRVEKAKSEGLEAMNANLCATQGEELALIGVARDCERAEAEAALSSALARIQVLEGALKPFALVADEYAPQEDDSHQVWKDAGPEPLIRASFRLSLYRAARAALQPTEESAK